MRATFAIAALAGSVIAAPNYGNGNPNEVQNVHLVVETVVQTVYVTEGSDIPKPTSSIAYVAPVYSAPAAVTTVVYQAPSYEPASSYEPAPPAPTPEAPAPAPAPEAPEPTPAPAPAPAPEPAAPAQGSGYMAIVSEYRQKLGLSPLAQSSELEGNAMNCLQSAPGVMDHKLNPGSYAQVLAPIASMDDFKHAFVGGWLCEKSNLLPNECPTQSSGWMYDGTGHADILTSQDYSKIGCAWNDGIVGCDLA